MKWYKKWFDLLTLSPLAILVFLLIGAEFVKNTFAAGAVYKDIALYRYFVIPMIGLVFALVVFLGILRKNWTLPESIQVFFNRHIYTILFIAIVAHTAFYSTILVLRYVTFHTSVIELGSYDHKIWNTAQLLPSVESLLVASKGHFQPILVFYAFWYKLFCNCPAIILILQVVTVVSAVVPLSLIAKEQLDNNRLWIGLLIMIYLMLPATGFNSVGDFHPDHLYIPMSLWAYYFAKRGWCFLALAAITVGSLAKEPLLLGAAFFGIYLAINMGKRWIGYISAVIFFLLFIYGVFYLQPKLIAHNTLEVFGFDHVLGIWEHPITFTEGVLNGITKKMLFIWFMLFPFMFLPLFSFKELIPTIPLFIIPIVSSNPDHSNIESQYTAGLIGAIFVAFILVLRDVRNRWGGRPVWALLILSVLLTGTLNFAKSPAPYSLSFWNKTWSVVWTYDNYLKMAYDKDMQDMLKLVPSNAQKVVVAQSNINYGSLAHRYRFYPFPQHWQRADYILFDMNKPYMYYDKEDATKFIQELANVQKSNDFTQIFNRSGLMLYARLDLVD
ncbi:MAG: DUF2079 domain-containing protein [Candidatus Magnetoovum sp. WYHC-5]|nr:DUF2079 domain-containing protein [Candidatus Magnetoovum sp. WYHC-5]